MRYLTIVIFTCILSINCAPRSSKIQRNNEYPQDFKTDVAWIVVEWNGKPDGWGSAFLINKERGIFLTNKHVGDRFNVYGKGSHKIFFNGRVYNIEIFKLPQVRDAALAKITDNFDSSGFPDPAPIATSAPKINQKITVEGFHVHPYRVREVHSPPIYKEKLVPVFRNYYNIGTINLDEEQELVFEVLSAKITGLNETVEIEDSSSGMINQIRNLTNTYIMAETEYDHSFSFAGLSGTIVRNEEGETVGIVTVEKAHYEQLSEDPKTGIKKLRQLFDILGITPISSIKELLEYAK